MILEIHPARVFRKRGVYLAQAGKHCKIDSEGSFFYKKLSSVKRVDFQKEGK